MSCHLPPKTQPQPPHHRQGPVTNASHHNTLTPQEDTSSWLSREQGQNNPSHSSVCTTMDLVCCQCWEEMSPSSLYSTNIPVPAMCLTLWSMLKRRYMKTAKTRMGKRSPYVSWEPTEVFREDLGREGSAKYQL